MAPNQNYSWQQYASGGDDTETLAAYFREQAIQRALEERNRAKLGYPTSAEPVQAVTPADIPAQTGQRPEPPIAGREEMLAANLRRAMGRDRMMLGAVVPGSLNQEQFVKELEGIKAMAPSVQAGGAVAAKGGDYSEVLGEAKAVYDPEQGRFVTKWNLGKVDPRYGYQSAEAIESYLSRSEAQPTPAPQQVAAAAARQAPVTPAPVRAAAPAAASVSRPQATPTSGKWEFSLMDYAKREYEAKKQRDKAAKNAQVQRTIADILSGQFSKNIPELYR